MKASKKSIGGLPLIGGKPQKPATKPPLSGRAAGGAVPAAAAGTAAAPASARKRGGKVPSSPFSGADGPNLGYAKHKG